MINNKVINKKKSNALIVVAVLISLGVSITAIIIAAPRTHDLSFDYYGVIVGILSLLVTALLGWNIYALIDFNRARQELRATEAKYNQTIITNNMLVHNALGDIFQTLAFGGTLRSYAENYIYYRILGLYYMSRIDISACGVLVKEIIDVIGLNPSNTKVSEGLKKQMLLLLSEIENTRNIEGFPMLIERVSGLSVRPVRVRTGYKDDKNHP